jgi:hypothetical protein
LGDRSGVEHRSDLCGIGDASLSVWSAWSRTPKKMWRRSLEHSGLRADMAFCRRFVATRWARFGGHVATVSLAVDGMR